MLVTFNNVTIKYVDKMILNKASFTINDTDKIGVVGVNGTGKSTLLKAIVDSVPLNDGIIYKKSGIRISYLPQEPVFNEESTILDEAIKLSNVENDFEAKSMLSKLGLDDFYKQIKCLSGGEKRRLSLAITLLKPCDLLMLDEPTNHLDIWMINWLEKILIKWNKALLLVTHDRYFLERITNKTIDIEMGSLYMYDANYSKYLDLKAERLEYQLASSRKLKAILKKEAVWASLNPQARSTKSKERLERFKELEEKVSESKDLISNISREMALSSKFSRLGRKTIILDNLSKEMNGKLLFSNLNYNVLRMDRLGIVGPNGSGKTTLFKTILGELEPTTGTITIGETVKIGYLKQEDRILNSKIRIIDYIKEFGETIDTVNGPLTASQLLEDFLFSKNTQYMPISTLSGGEKRRLQLLSILITNPNILFLDEPTNDLDIYTLELLEDYLESFKGAVIVISHDRYFLDKVINHSLIYENNNLFEYTGLISDYITDATTKKKEHIEKVKIERNIPRFTSSEKKEFDTIEEKIFKLEEEIDLLRKETYLCGTDYQKLIELNNKIDEQNIKLNQMYERYEYLNNINEQIEQYKKEKYNG